MDNSANSVYLTFDKGGILERAEPDTLREDEFGLFLLFIINLTPAIMGSDYRLICCLLIWTSYLQASIMEVTGEW